MDPYLTLEAAIIVVYLVDCLFWVRRGSTVFQTWLSSHARGSRPGSLFANARGALILSNPWPPLGSTFVTEPWPISVGPKGVHNWVRSTLYPEDRKPNDDRFLSFDAIKTVRADGRALVLNGRPFAMTSSPRLCRSLVALIRELRELPENKRKKRLKEAVASRFDIPAITVRIDAYRRDTLGLRLLANLFLVGLLGAIPLVVWSDLVYGREPFFYAWLTVVWLTTHFVWHRAHRRLFPDDTVDRRRELLMHLPSIPSAARAPTFLSRDLLALHHPLAAAFALSRPAAYRDLATVIARDVVHPTPLPGTLEGDAAETVAFHHAAIERSVRRLIDRSRLDIDELLAPPKPESEKIKSHCPRCHAQYMNEEGACEDCFGLGLQPLAS